MLPTFGRKAEFNKKLQNYRSTKKHFLQADCILTPTSLGFRKSLQSEGIVFSMPLQRQNEITAKRNEGAG